MSLRFIRTYDEKRLLVEEELFCYVRDKNLMNSLSSNFSFAMIELGSDTSAQLVTEKLPKM